MGDLNAERIMDKSLRDKCLLLLILQKQSFKNEKQ